VGGLVAGLAFAFRDLGSPLVRLPLRKHQAGREASRFPLWRIPIARGLHDRRYGLLVWMAGFAALATLFVILTKEIVQPLLDIARLRPFFNTLLQGDLYPAFLGFIWFGFGQLLIAGYAITQVGRWAAEDGDGRLELSLSEPMSRLGILLERAVVLMLGALAIAAAGAIAVALEAHREGIDLSTSRLVTASLLFVPFAAFFGALGSIAVYRIPRAALGLLGGFAFASYFVMQLAPIFKWPAWVEDISPFHLYGEPLSSGVDGVGLSIMLAVVVVGFAAAAFLFQRRDVGA
jgi:ABC-2 type transport system permease protein